MTSAQVGKTEIINNIVGYFVHHDPSPMLIVQPTIDMAEAYSKDRLSAMIRDTPALRRIIGDGKTRSSTNTLRHKSFPGGHITLAGSNSPASLASRPVRLVLFDEVDRFPFSAGTEGDPVSLGKKRTTTFFNRISVLVSTPTRKGSSRIELAYEQSDKRLYKVPCPHCDHFQFLDFKNLRFPENNPNEAEYQCENCDSLISHVEKKDMLKLGHWESTNNEVTNRAGFHINELYSPWKSWGEVAQDYLEAKKSEETLKTFWNTSLGLPYEAKNDAPEWELLFNRDDGYKRNTIPKDVLFLTCGIDIQGDRIELEIVGWGKNKQSWSIDYRVIYGDTSQAQTFRKLDEIMSETWEIENGNRIPILRTAIDSGYQTQNVYDWARQYPQSKVIAIKGQESLNQIFKMPSDLSKRRKKTKGNWVRIWHLGTNLIKRELFAWFKLDKPTDAEIIDKGYPFGFCQFPNDYDALYFKMLCSESEAVKMVNGYPRYYFQKVFERNEALDCRVYARAAASTLGLDSMSDSKLEKLKNVSTETSKQEPKKQKRPKIKRIKSSMFE
jgi:phage terminase large subunit GpA-like protein